MDEPTWEGRTGAEGCQCESWSPGVHATPIQSCSELRMGRRNASGINEGPLIPVLAGAWGGHLATQHPGGASGKEPTCQCRRLKRSLGREDPLE